MRITEIALGMKRTVRLKQYVVITPEAWLKAELETNEDPDKALEELRQDVIFMLNHMEELEAAKLGFFKNLGTGEYQEVSE
jgi:hypothetical protein